MSNIIQFNADVIEVFLQSASLLMKSALLLSKEKVNRTTKCSVLSVFNTLMHSAVCAYVEWKKSSKCTVVKIKCMNVACSVDEL